MIEADRFVAQPLFLACGDLAPYRPPILIFRESCFCLRMVRVVLRAHRMNERGSITAEHPNDIAAML